MKRAVCVILVAFGLAGCEKRETPKTTPADGAPNVTTVNPQEILFSTPTLNDAIPASVNSSVPRDRWYQMHEDDWRQFEFVSASYRGEMAGELEAIDRIWKEQSVPLGDQGTAFRKVHVRERIARPLDFRMSVSEFEALLGGRAHPMAFFGDDKVLQNVHAIRLSNVIVYAVIEADRISTLGIEPVDRFTITGDMADRLERLLIQQDLRLVHWRSRTLFETPQSAMEYLRGKGG